MSYVNGIQGLSCPECNTQIKVDIHQLLVTGKLVCPRCKREIALNQNLERASALKKFSLEFSKAKSRLEQAGYIQAYYSEKRTYKHTRRVTTRSRRVVNG